MSNKMNLELAKKNKNDEFYTTKETIEKEVSNYTDKFKNKVIYMNCDDPELFKNFWGSKTWEKLLEEAVNKKDTELLKKANCYFKEKNPDYVSKASQFWVYFHKRMKVLEIKEIIATHYDPTGKTTYGMRYKGNGDNDDIYDFEPIWFTDSNGDFRDKECVELLKESDIVITNPPFSLFREYINQIVKYEKKFLVIGNLNAVSYKDIFPLIKEEKIWLGATQPKKHKIPIKTEFNPKKMEWDNEGNLLQKFGNQTWFTNIDFSARYQELWLSEEYSPNKYKKYDNYNAINVDAIKTNHKKGVIQYGIPKNYYEVMGVPITFLTKWNPNQFQIVDLNAKDPYVEGQKKYARLLVKKR